MHSKFIQSVGEQEVLKQSKVEVRVKRLIIKVTDNWNQSCEDILATILTVLPFNARLVLYMCVESVVWLLINIGLVKAIETS